MSDRDRAVDWYDRFLGAAPGSLPDAAGSALASIAECRIVPDSQETYVSGVRKALFAGPPAA